MSRISQFIIVIMLFLFVCEPATAWSQYIISSPDGKFTAEIIVGEQLTWSLALNDTQLIVPHQFRLRFQAAKN